MTGAAAAAWTALAEGNARFVAGGAEHPRQDAARRSETASGQSPSAVVLGCSDSRVPPELLFDAGLGDVFVVRNAGQVADPAAVASIEYGVGVLGAPLVVVLSHESCGAVAAAIAAAGPDAPALPALIAAHVARIEPAVLAAPARDAETVLHTHLEATASALLQASELVAAGVAGGSVAVVGAEYRLAEGRVQRRFALGAL